MNENPATKKETSEEWTMPEPIFRSSEGVSLKKEAADEDTLKVGAEDEVPTETMGFVPKEEPMTHDEPATTEKTEQPVAASLKQIVRVKEKRRRRHHRKKRTRSKIMRGLALLIGLLVGSVILAITYFLSR